MRFIQLILASLVFCSCASQKNTRVYAYRQPVLQGAKPVAVVDEKGREVDMPVRERPANFFIYLEMPPANVEMKTIWIKQKPYVANFSIVQTTPVVLVPQVSINNAGDTLVKATKNRVFQISPGDLKTEGMPSSGIAEKIKNNELVIHCVVNGKNQYYSLAAIKNLPPVALQ
jgi:hypothetical protein